MKINTALILCAGLGKRLNPLTLDTPKPLLKLNDITILEKCINTIIKLGVKRVILNTFHLGDQIFDFVNNKNFKIDINIVEDGSKILDTGGGILNMIRHSEDENFLVFNPDTLWNEIYIQEIDKMKNFYFENRLNNLLLVVNKKLSFDNNLIGDFELKSNLLKKNDNKNFIYIGCQILNKNLFQNYEIINFSISEIWNKLLGKNMLNGFESINKFYHLTNLETFKKLKDL
ncbi:NTP transferase domain-containing protein [Pelagibacterales bacterium SAG-MED11]|nr:NTP transferase domain-containing protein [Pelagibacterales bacterium SAG-MED11]